MGESMAASDDPQNRERPTIDERERRREIRGNVPLLFLLGVMLALFFIAAVLGIGGPFHSPKVASAPVTVPSGSAVPPRPLGPVKGEHG